MVEQIDVHEYVLRLMDYLKRTYQQVKEHAEKVLVDKEGLDRGAPGARGLAVGDLVALKKTAKPSGAGRFGWTTDGIIYRITAVLGENTYEIRKLGSDESPVTRSEFANRFPADRLVKLDMPEWEQPAETGSPQKVELYCDAEAVWREAVVERWAIDGRVYLRFADTPAEGIWLDLTKCRYRWLVTNPAGSEGAQADGDADH